MFKTIFTTLMLCTSVGTPLIKQPQKVVGTNTLYGAYCLRDEFNLNDLEDYYSSTYDIYDYVSSSDLDNFQIAQCLYIDANNYYYTQIRHFEIEFTDVELNITINMLNFNFYGSNYYDDLNGASDLGIYIRGTVVYFPVPTYLTSETLKVFFMFFTSTGNSWVTYYNGYYNINNAINNTNNWTYFGQTIIDNNIYMNITKNNNKLITGSGIGSSITIFNGTSPTIVNRNMLINGTLINNVMFARMGQDGTFTYVPSTTTNDFQDLIFSVMDAPIYYLSSLFSFELFGIQFYVAFMSIVTLLLIVAVVRKII